MASRETAQSIEWHEECYANWLRSHQTEVDRLQAIADRVAKGGLDLDRYRRQIDEAKRRKKKSFDRDKFFVQKREVPDAQ